MSTALAIDLEDYERREFADPIAVAVENVRRRGDGALCPGSPMPLRLGAAELDQCLGEMPAVARADLRLVQEQTRAIAAAQRAAIADVESSGPDGVTVGTRHVPVESVGICLPDTLESSHAHIAAQSAAIAARIAGVERVLACVPAPAGRPDPSLVAALVLAGVDEIYRCAGARAFAALRLGTETIPRVDVAYAIVDPELEEADHALGGSVDRPGGHGLLIIADDDADAELVAADLIAAGECGAGARGVLISTSPALGARVAGAVERQLGALPNAGALSTAWRRRGAIHVAGDPETACALADRHAFARVEVVTADPRWYLERLRRCSVVLLGAAAGVALADVSARRPGGAVWAATPNPVLEFVRSISYREADRCVDGVAFARQRRLLGLEAHARACELRAVRSVQAGREAVRAPATALR